MVAGSQLPSEITARTVFSSWKRFKRRNTPRFRRFFLEKRPWKRFFTNVLIRGKWIHSTANKWEQSCTGSNAAPEKSLQKNLSRKIARFLVSKISPATGVTLRRSQDQLLRPKIERYFLESFFLERNYCRRTAFSGSNSCSILSHPVISWNGQNSFRDFSLKFPRFLLHLKFPSNSQIFTTPQTAFL